MKRDLLSIMVCPSCRKGLSLTVLEKRENDVHEGLLACKKCENKYPIINSIPRMLPASMINKDLLKYFEAKYGRGALKTGNVDVTKDQETKEKTSRSFGFQWNVFSEIFKEYEKNFLDYINPLKPPFFRGKLVLDAGCGFGRHTYYAAKYGSEVVGFDISDAVESARKNTKKFHNVHIVQGDIYNMPFRSGFDFIMSIGVLHHLPKPRHGYLELVKLARPGTRVFAWLYGKEGRTFKTVFLEGTIRKITVGMPQRMLYYFCYLPALLYHISNQFYKLLNRIGAAKIAEMMPFKNYANFPFRVKLADAYDFLGTPINNYYTKEECESWAKEAKLKDVSVTSLGGRSWRVLGKK